MDRRSTNDERGHDVRAPVNGVAFDISDGEAQPLGDGGARDVVLGLAVGENADGDAAQADLHETSLFT